MSKLQLKNLNKTFSPKVVPVKDISLTVDDGDFLSLLGPSGCGKSTILRMIAGLEEPTRGQVLIGDRDVTYTRPGDRNVAMVFQSYALYPHLTVYENLCAGLKLKKTPVGEIQQRVTEVSEVLGLNELMQRKPGKLSGGQRQRVAVGRALVRRPDVFLLDEPLSNLDALLREHVRADLKQIFAAQGVPVVYVTHDQTEAMTLSTQVAVLNDGYLQQLDAPEQIYNRPANQFVAGFVGSPQMNLLTLPCQGHHALLGDFKIPLPDRIPTVPAQITLGIRPEHLHIAEPEDSIVVKGAIFLVENLGMHNLISFRVANSQGDPIVLRALLPPDVWMGRELAIAIPPELTHWFDVQSGDALGGVGSGV
ncbi:ABC transporter ATP-binding protein [Kovacikia minuta CCNUW1]|uniref:ABC transporter ATP-binding protein n=1 Tax=Kovacikia minuta TaxID=2931930 RepID=UPI001CCFFA00|nr:ABC transporter ATP-binding protein [Kovacikia minuta]UBF29052.1 ABC transporter ATP-binding protein [Kovacikia minuta CCNUW1]